MDSKVDRKQVELLGSKDSGRQVTCEGSVVEPILFNLLVNDLDDGTEYTLSKFADNTKLDRVADTTGSCAAIQRDRLTLTGWGNELTRTS